MTAPVETKPVTPPVETGGNAVDTGSAETTPLETSPTSRRARSTGPRPIKHVETKQSEPKHVETKVAPPPVETKAKPIDTGALVAQYKSIGAELQVARAGQGRRRGVGPAGALPMIRITDAMTTQDKRDAAAKLLSKLHAASAHGARRCLRQECDLDAVRRLGRRRSGWPPITVTHTLL